MGLLIIPVSSTCFGKLFCPKHVEPTGIINKPLLLHLVGCLYYLYQWCTVKQVSDNEVHLLIKHIKRVIWRVAKRLSYIQDARCLKVKPNSSFWKSVQRLQYEDSQAGRKIRSAFPVKVHKNCARVRVCVCVWGGGQILHELQRFNK